MVDLKQYRNVLTFFAHPDDETLAAGATIHKLTGLGAVVHVAIPATGIHSRRNTQDVEKRDIDLVNLRRDCEKALAILGVQPSHIHLGNFPDNEMDRHSLLEVIHWLEEVMKTVKPDLVLTHHRFCTNIDHQYCHKAVIITTRPGLNKNVHVICGEVPSSTGYLRPAHWEPNLYIEATEQSVNAKIAAMEAYSGEVRPDPHPRSREVLYALAKVRGSEAGFFHAEAFMISRIFA